MAGMKELGNPILPSNSSERFENGYILSEHLVNFKIKCENRLKLDLYNLKAR